MAMKQAMDMYSKANKMGNDEHELKFQKVLENEINCYFQELMIKEKRNYKIMEEEKKKLQLTFELKEKEQIEKFENEKKAIEEKHKKVGISHLETTTEGRTNKVEMGKSKFFILNKHPARLTIK